ncbi:MAG: hypothetical protein U0637_03555 [Phycisphaerales bacterium]
MPDTAQAGAQGTTPSTTSKRKGRTWKIILGGAGFLIAGVVILVGFAPRIAGGMAPGIVSKQAATLVKGAVTVDSASLSWSGPQRIGPIVWKDEAGQVVAKATVETSAGLLGLATGSLDLGTVTLSGVEANVSRAQDGTINIQSLLKQPPSGSTTPGSPARTPEPPSIPAGLKARLLVKDLHATFTDHAAPGGTQEVSLRDATLDAVLDANKPLEIKLTAKAQQPGAGDPGSITLDVRATNWAAPDGKVTPGKATLTAKGTISTLPVAMLDAIVPPFIKDAQGHAIPLATVLGPALTASIDANGSLKDATAKLHAQTARAGMDGDIRIADGTLSDASPITIHATGAALKDALPALAGAAAPDAATRLDALPDATLTLDQLHLRLPQGGQPMDLRGAAARVQIALTEVVGQTRMAPAEPIQVMRIAPLTALAETQDLAAGVHLTASTSATLANRPAGDVAVDMMITGLLDDKGAAATTTPLVSGTAKVRKISTAIAQPFAEPLGLDLPRDVGPTLDLEIKAATRAAATDIDLSAEAQFLTASGGFTLSPTQIGTKSNDFAITMKRGGGLIALFVKPETGLRVQPPQSGNGEVTLLIRALSIPREAPAPGAAPVLRLDQMAGSLTATAAGLRVSRTASSTPPIDLSDLQVRAAVAPGKESTLDISGKGTHANAPFSIAGNFAVTDLWTHAASGPATLNTDIKALRPAGRLQITDLPPAALALAQPAPPAAKDAPPAPDFAALARETFGSKIGIDLGIKRTEDAATTEVVARISGGASSTVNRFRLSPAELKGTENFAKLALTPGLLDALLRTWKPEFAGKLHLAAAAEVQAGLAPFSVPMQGLTPQWDKAKPVHATVTIPGRVSLEGLASLLDEKSSLRTLTSAGLEGLSLEADIPPAPFLAPAPANAAKAPLNATLRAAVLANGERTTNLAGTLAGDFASAAPAGPLALNLELSDIATAAAERALGQDALLTSVLGDTAKITLKATTDQAAQTTSAELIAAAPKLKAEGPIALRISPQALEVTKSAKWQCTLAPEWINQKLTTPPAPNQQAKPPAFTVTSPVDLGLTIDRLVLPRAEGGPTLAAALGIVIPRINAQSSDKRPAVLDNTTLTLTTQEGAASPTLAFRLNVASAQAGDSPAATNVGLSGVIENLVSPQGAIDPARATVTAAGKIPSLPTALVDVLAGQDGVLVEALGPMIALDLDARNVPLKPAPAPAGTQTQAGGTLKLNATSDRATLSAQGSIDDSVLTLSQPLNVSILELTDALAGRFVKGLPAIGTIQKNKTDRPAMIVGENLRIPLSKDLSRLNGTVRIDPGEARFATSSLFGQLLDLAKVKTTGTIGQKLDPLTVTLTNGVATYPRYRLPLGEFSIETEGTVDLAARKVDVITWVPLGSLTDQAAGLFKANTGIGSLLGKTPVLDNASMVPFRTKGPMDDPRTNADLELFGKNLLKSVDPSKLLEQGLDLLKKKDKDQPPKDPGK